MRNIGKLLLAGTGIAAAVGFTSCGKGDINLTSDLRVEHALSDGKINQEEYDNLSDAEKRNLSVFLGRGPISFENTNTIEVNNEKLVKIAKDRIDTENKYDSENAKTSRKARIGALVPIAAFALTALSAALVKKKMPNSKIAKMLTNHNDPNKPSLWPLAGVGTLIASMATYKCIDSNTISKNYLYGQSFSDVKYYNGSDDLVNYFSWEHYHTQEKIAKQINNNFDEFNNNVITPTMIEKKQTDIERSNDKLSKLEKELKNLEKQLSIINKRLDSDECMTPKEALELDTKAKNLKSEISGKKVAIKNSKATIDELNHDINNMRNYNNENEVSKLVNRMKASGLSSDEVELLLQGADGYYLAERFDNARCNYYSQIIDGTI